MALETAGGIASIAAIIIDVASICLRLRNRIQEMDGALNDLDADIGHLERVLRQFQNAESEQQRWQPRNIPDDAQTIVDDCKRLRQRFADKVKTWRQDRYTFGYNWKPVYLFFFQQTRMRHASKHDLIREAAVTREKMGMMSANHVETVNSLQSLEEDLAGLTKGLEDLKTKIKRKSRGMRTTG